MKKVLIGIVAALAVMLALLVVVKDVVIKGAAETAVAKMTGLKLQIKEFRSAILNPMIDIKGLVLSNPVGFSDPVMVNMPEVFVNLDMGALLGGKAHIKDLRIDLAEFIVVKNRNGSLNLDALKIVKADKAKKPTASAAAKQEAAKESSTMPQIRIDRLKLKIGKVVYKDYTAGPDPRVQTFSINLDEEYKDINDPNVLMSIIISRALANTAVSSLTNFDVSGLQMNVKQYTVHTQKMAMETVDKATKALEGTSGLVGGIAGPSAQATTQETIKKTQETVKNVLGGFSFGGDEKK